MPEPILISEDTPAAWSEYGKYFDYVPDPMIIRTAELFVSGREGCAEIIRQEKGKKGELDQQVKDSDLEDIWSAIDSNLHGLLTFFNILVNREAIPGLAYRETYPREGVQQFYRLLEPIWTDVCVASDVYNRVKGAALERLRTLQVNQARDHDVADVLNELQAFNYEWQPDVGELSFADKGHESLARFLLGGLIFGRYAEATDSDHIMQNKRSRIFVALTKPEYEEGAVSYDREANLFENFVIACRRSEAVRVDEMPSTPNIVPHLLLGAESPINSPLDLLKAALDLRGTANGDALMNWFRDLRNKISEGQYAAAERKEIESVRKELVHRLEDQYPKWNVDLELEGKVGPSVDLHVQENLKFSAELASAKASAKVRVGIPDWIRNWLLDLAPIGRHRKLLLRVGLAEAEYMNLPKRLKKLWMEADLPGQA